MSNENKTLEETLLETTINFRNDICIDPYFRQFDEKDIFIIIKQCRNGLYLLKDKFGKTIQLPKSNLNIFQER